MLVCAITLLYLIFTLKLTERPIPIGTESLGKPSKVSKIDQNANRREEHAARITLTGVLRL
jgi:hypothetical protein